jgi:hypothetical protein
MNDAEKRKAVMDAYPGAAWVIKVEQMSNQQIHSIYTRLLRSNKLKGKVS